ncbi:50S ribosome-binding protein YggL [Bowmanella denitrificans]
MIKTRHDNKSRRLRKKLYLGEFTVLGMDLDCSLAGEDEDVWVDAFLDWLESQHLCFGGGVGAGQVSGYICAKGRYDSVTQAQWQLLHDWLSAQRHIKNVVLSSLNNAWYADQK